MININKQQSKFIFFLAYYCIVLLIWELYVRLHNPDFTLSSPSAILTSIIQQKELWLEQSLPTLFVAISGLVLGLVLAFITSSIIAFSRLMDTALTPLVLASQTLPIVAIGPIIASIIGAGLFSQVVITAWLCWFPAVIAFTYGMQNVPAERLNLMKISEASKWQIYTKLQLPGSANYIVSGIRASAGLALISAIVIEYGGAEKGLGATIIQYVNGSLALSNDALIALVVICSLLGLTITWFFYSISKLALGHYLVD